MNRKTSNTRCFTWVRALLVVAAAVELLPLAAWAAQPETVLFNGKDLSGWRQSGEWIVVKSVSVDPKHPTKFTSQPGEGVLLNGRSGRTIDLVSKAEFGDLELHVEFCIPKSSNSGVYVMGQYEVQVYDSFGVVKDHYPGIECGGIYQRWSKERGGFEGHSPRVNASKRPGQWQTFDIVFRAPRFAADGKKIANAKFIKVLHNGQVVHENVEVTGPTRGGLFENERPSGPVRLQGDHGPVAYRNLVLKPLASTAAE
jgi:hypothetical protein